jgi:hypothetical protein
MKWRSHREFRTGTLEGIALAGVPGGLVIDKPLGTMDYTDPSWHTTRTYEYARWTSPTHEIGFDATQLVASWNASTPEGTWLQTEMRATTASGQDTPWYVLGRWASDDQNIRRTSVPNQTDANGSVDVDTFKSAPGVGLRSYQLRATLYRLVGSHDSARLHMLAATTSALPDRFTVPTSPAGGAWGIELPVPRYSQNIHKGEYPEYDGGGEAWCSPTSTEMVVEYWGKHPSKEQLSWVDPSHADPSVDHAARHTYDYAYAGAGNWPFNTAYAATYGLHAYVTRLGSLTDVERYIRNRIPVITSQSFQADELDGAHYGSSGHIMVVVGFTPEGDVIANDPASPSNDAVRHVYNRAQFENIWLRTKRHAPDGSVADGSGGIAYIIRPNVMAQ